MTLLITKGEKHLPRICSLCSKCCRKTSLLPPLPHKCLTSLCPPPVMLFPSRIALSTINTVEISSVQFSLAAFHCSRATYWNPSLLSDLECRHEVQPRERALFIFLVETLFLTCIFFFFCNHKYQAHIYFYLKEHASLVLTLRLDYVECLTMLTSTKYGIRFSSL